MVRVGHIDISPPLLNASCLWASELDELRSLYHSPYTGAVTTRTATLTGFAQDHTHTVAFLKDSQSSVNSYGYSPHPLHTYLVWIKEIIASDPRGTKPFIISITANSPSSLSHMLSAIQTLRTSTPGASSRIAIELNTSCPNIPHQAPPAYRFPSLAPLLDVLAQCFSDDRTLTIGLKLPPYVAEIDMEDVVSVVAGYSRMGVNPFAFFTCTNTLGCSLVFAEQAVTSTSTHFALPTPLGGISGAPLHSLALGNVYTFSKALAHHPDSALRSITIIGVGGVGDRAGVERMLRAGAGIVGCATGLGRRGVGVFELLSTPMPPLSSQNN